MQTWLSFFCFPRWLSRPLSKQASDSLLDEKRKSCCLGFETLAGRKGQEETSPGGKVERMKGRSLAHARPSLVGLGPLNQCKRPRQWGVNWTFARATRARFDAGLPLQGSPRGESRPKTDKI